MRRTPEESIRWGEAGLGVTEVVLALWWAKQGPKVLPQQFFGFLELGSSCEWGMARSLQLLDGLGGQAGALLTENSDPATPFYR